MRECKAQGARVLLLTSKNLQDEDWPFDCIDKDYFIEAEGEHWDIRRTLASVAFMSKHEKIDRIVALDDFDLEKAAALREHLRVPGMGDTRTRYFRDKLSMRMKAEESGIPVPEYVHVLNHDEVNKWMDSVKGPWVIKPRMQASAAGIHKVNDSQQAWDVLNDLGEEQSYYLIERFVPGHIYHVDSIIDNSEVIFHRVSRYMSPPMEVVQGGGIFRTHTLPFDSTDSRELGLLNEQIIQSFGLRRGVSHTEFIRAHADGKPYFLETSARVGGAHIAEMVEASCGFSFWKEWAKLETLPEGQEYQLPKAEDNHAGIITTLSRQEHPDLSDFSDDEVFWRMNKRHHAGIIVRSPDYDRVVELLDNYAGRFAVDFHASLPGGDLIT